MRFLISFLFAVLFSATAQAASFSVPSFTLTGGTVSCTFYTSPTGSDSNSGTSPSAPFKTLEKAQTSTESLVMVSATVCLEGGAYPRTRTLSLTNSNDANKIWTPYLSQTPILDGGGAVAEGIVIMEPSVVVSGLTLNNFATVGIQYGNGTGPIVGGGSIVNNTVTNLTTNPPSGGFTHTFCILGQDAPSLLISGNTCANITGDGIGYGTNHDTTGHVSITNNKLTNICSGTAPDCAALYNFNSNATTGPGVGGFVVSHNFIDGFGPQINPSPNGAPVCLYTDDGASNVAYSFNVCTGSGTYGFLIHGGHNVTHTNDIFDVTSILFVGIQQDCTSPSDGDCPTTSPMTGDSFTHNIVYSSNPTIQPTLWTYLKSGSGPVTTISISGNLYFNTIGTFHNSGTTRFSAPSPQMIDSAPVVANPLFVNAAAHNYALQSGSPAHALGF